MNKMPKISIITPVFNAERTIGKMISSVIDQQYKNVELIILDGKSTDHTVEIIKRYESYITYWHSKPDANPIIAINEGIRIATGDLVVLLMPDDFYEPGTLQRIGEAFLENPHVDMITCGGRIIYYDEKNRCYKTKRSFTTAEKLALTVENICFDVSTISCRFIKKSFLEESGLFTVMDKKGKHLYSADKEFLLRAMFSSVKNIFVEHVGHNYLAHQRAATFSGNKNIMSRLYEEHMIFAENFLKKSNLLPEQRKLLAYWYRHQSSRLTIHHFLQGSFKEAFKMLIQNIRKHKVRWVLDFIMMPFQFIVQRTAQGWKREVG